MFHRRCSTLPLCALGGALLSVPALAPAALLDPATAPWGGWTRGAAGTLYAGWDRFADETPSAPPPALNPIRDTTPELAADLLIGGGSGTGGPASSYGLDSAVLDETTGTAFITSGGNIYSPTTITEFTLTLETATTLASPSRIALQVRTQGSELDYGAVTLNGFAADAVEELFRQPLGGFGGNLVDTLFLWTLAAPTETLAFAFAAAESSVSLDAVTVDAATVPLPAALWLGLAGTAGLATRLRRSTDAAVARARTDEARS